MHLDSFTVQNLELFESASKSGKNSTLINVIDNLEKESFGLKSKIVDTRRSDNENEYLKRVSVRKSYSKKPASVYAQKTNSLVKKFKEKEGPGPANMRQMQIDEIKKSPNLPVLVFTHPKDPVGGLVSDWVEEISGVERIVISQNNKVNEKSCNVWGKPIKNYHDMDRATCFKEYNPKILDFIASKIN